jgi:hypothetical protein
MHEFCTAENGMTATVLIAHPSKEPTIISRFIKFIAASDKIAEVIIR